MATRINVFVCFLSLSPSLSLFSRSPPLSLSLSLSLSLFLSFFQPDKLFIKLLLVILLQHLVLLLANLIELTSFFSSSCLFFELLSKFLVRFHIQQISKFWIHFSVSFLSYSKPDETSD
jgi:hypothetical protein